MGGSECLMQGMLFAGQEAHLLLQASGRHDHTLDALQHVYAACPTHPQIMAATKSFALSCPGLSATLQS